jgi:hypothetical protein
MPRIVARDLVASRCSDRWSADQHASAIYLAPIAVNGIGESLCKSTVQTRAVCKPTIYHLLEQGNAS